MSSPLLEVKDLQVTVGEEQKVLLDGLNLTVNPGETHVLMGHNGAGKSTLMSALMGDPRYTVTRGSIVFRGQDVTHESADVRALVGYILPAENNAAAGDGIAGVAHQGAHQGGFARAVVAHQNMGLAGVDG